MKNIKLAFVDFWGGFNSTRNFFYFALGKFGNVEIVSPESADIIIFSCYSNHKTYYRNQIYTNDTQYPGKVKIFYTAENIRPDYNNLDYSISFDFDDNGKIIRLPLWMIQIDWFGLVDYDNPKYTISPNEIYNNKFYKNTKSKFCSIVYNHASPYREDIIRELSKYKPVDIYGNKYGNLRYGEDAKLEVISNYKFNICLENSLYPGYYTEKPIHAKVAGCVPIYWSDENVSKDFNHKAFVNLSDYNCDVKSLCEYIIELDKDNDKYLELRNQPLFLPDQNPRLKFENFMEKLEEIIKKL